MVVPTVVIGGSVGGADDSGRRRLVDVNVADGSRRRIAGQVSATAAHRLISAFARHGGIARRTAGC